MELEEKGWTEWWESRKTCPEHNILCFDEKSSETSLIDKWSVTHIFWGAVYSIPVFYIEAEYSFLITFAAAIIFEIIENSTIGHRIAKIICCSDFYQGDNFWNSVFDVFFNLIGWLIMYTIHTRMVMQ